MRRSWLWLGSAAFLVPTAASAADQLKFGAAPTWVVPQVIPPATAKGADRPVALLLHDQQVRLEPKAIVGYSELAFKIQKPEGLAAGNLSVAWDPARDTMTINKLEIRRGGQTIDVLKSGQTFTTMRRESNLEVAMLDGMLTANIQPEGLQEGDILVLATTTEHSDPVLKGHVETVFAPWGENQIRLAHARLLWPSNLAIKVQKTGDIPAPQLQSASDGFKVYELTMGDTDPVIAPKGAPLRFRIGRMGEATDFQSWADAAKLFVPLFAEAAVVPASGPLRDEVENIRKASTNPKTRAEQALQLVEGRIRYVALLMGQGGLVPASAETTWSRRFGDCKAKTALLLAILHELGIAAEPVAANPILGDIIGERLPSIGMFNHVLVRAHIGGKDYWLDGTRTGDNHLDDIEVPDFGWVLPLMTGAQLVHLVPPPLKYPTSERRLEVDATAGILAPAPTLGEQILRGDVATVYNARLSSLSEGQRQEYFRSYWTAIFDSLTVTSASAKFDKIKNELRLTMAGEAKLDWNTGYFHVPDSGVGYEPNFDRPPGPQHDAPIAVGFPAYASTTVRLHMPTGFLGDRPMGFGDVHETLAGVEYVRTSLHEGDFLTVQTRARSLVPEVAYKDAVAAKPRLRALSDEDAALPVPNSYRLTARDLVELAHQQPGSAKEFMRRGDAYLDARRFDEAIDDFTKALELDPKNVNALSDRGLAYVWKNEFDLGKGDLAAAQAIEPGNAVVMRARGLNAEHEGDCDGAINFYSKSLEVDPTSNFAIGHRAVCEHQVGKEDEALADSSRALQTDHRWMDLRVLRANAFYLRGDTAAVAKEAELLTRENPGADYAYVAAGKIYARIGRKTDAMKAFDAALAIKPLPYIFLNRAQTRPFTDYAGRLADIEAALKLDPNDVDTLAEKAEQLAAAGDLKSALKLYDQIKQLAPDNDHLALRRSIILYKSGATAEAEKLISVRRSKAKTASDLNSLCWAKATAGIMLESAQQDCLDALKLNPSSGATLDSLAFVTLRLGKIDEAIRLYTKAIDKRIVSESYMGRAVAYARKGDKAHSDLDREQALRLDQDAETRFAEYGLKR